jgi:arabinose-5-phosphate isomerase
MSHKRAIDFEASAKRTIGIESSAISALAERIDSQFSTACELLLGVTGRVIVTGIGKSGHIARKIAATLASTGTPAYFVHPAEASHGDMGMITAADALIALSNSGNVVEILTLLPLIKRMGVPLIAITGRTDSPLAQAAEAVLDTSVNQEACPLDLAPTSSTTAALVMGDALAIALLEARGFTAEDFAFSHPGGALGRKLLLRVSDVMHSGERVPRVSTHTTLYDALFEVTRKGLGMTTVVDDQNTLQGIFTDGDLRRSLDAGIELRSSRIVDVMTRAPKTITAQALAAEALHMMETHKISAIVVSDEQQRVQGIVHIMALLQAGIA